MTNEVWYDETHDFAAAQERLRNKFGDEWEAMHRQASTIARISLLSYSEAVDHILRREAFPVVPTVQFHNPRGYGKTATMEAFEEFGRAWARLVADIGKVLEPYVRHVADRLEPPANVMERALQARKNRNTGPARPTGQAARRPRRHQ